MEAICSSETSVDTQRTTPRYIPEVNTLPNHSCENLNSYMNIWYFGTNRIQTSYWLLAEGVSVYYVIISCS
jgi:hypothetical protein